MAHGFSLRRIARKRIHDTDALRQCQTGVRKVLVKIDDLLGEGHSANIDKSS